MDTCASMAARQSMPSCDAGSRRSTRSNSCSTRTARLRCSVSRRPWPSMSGVWNCRMLTTGCHCTGKGHSSRPRTSSGSCAGSTGWFRGALEVTFARMAQAVHLPQPNHNPPPPLGRAPLGVGHSSACRVAFAPSSRALPAGCLPICGPSATRLCQGAGCCAPWAPLSSSSLLCCEWVCVGMRLRECVRDGVQRPHQTNAHRWCAWQPGQAHRCRQAPGAQQGRATPAERGSVWQKGGRHSA